MLEESKRLTPGITTSEIDEDIINLSASMGISNPYYLTVAGRLAVDNHQKNTLKSFRDKMKLAYRHTTKVFRKPDLSLVLSDKTQAENNFELTYMKHAPLITSKFFEFVETYQNELEAMIDYSRDFLLDFFGIRTFQQSYSLKIDGKGFERPQDMFMRVAIQVTDPWNPRYENSSEFLVDIKETYDLFSNKCYTHASPTIYNSGGVNQQLASCFLLGIEDSIKGIFKTISDCAERGWETPWKYRLLFDATSCRLS